MAEVSLVKLPSDECHWTLLMVKSTLAQVMVWCHQATSHYLSQCWPKPTVCFHMASLGHNELKYTSAQSSFSVFWFAGQLWRTYIWWSSTLPCLWPVVSQRHWSMPIVWVWRKGECDISIEAIATGVHLDRFLCYFLCDFEIYFLNEIYC